MNKENLKIVFFGTPEFAVESLAALVEGGYNIAAVVTMPDKLAGRGHKLIQSDVKKYALEHGLNILQPEKLKDQDFIDRLQEINADLFIVIAFRMLPEKVWQMPTLGTFNLHGSILPKYRGAAPINRAIMNGEKRTGVTVFFLKHEIDTGDIIDVREIEVGDDENVGSVYDRLMKEGSKLVIETVDNIINGTVTTRPQPEGEFSPAPKIFKEDCRINWDNSDLKIHNQVRGLSPYPAAFSTILTGDGKEIPTKIFVTSLKNIPEEIEKQCDSKEPGEIIISCRRMFVKSSTGPVEILELQPAGKKRMSVSDFLLGYHPVKFMNSDFLSNL